MPSRFYQSAAAHVLLPNYGRKAGGFQTMRDRSADASTRDDTWPNFSGRWTIAPSGLADIVGASACVVTLYADAVEGFKFQDFYIGNGDGSNTLNGAYDGGQVLGLWGGVNGMTVPPGGNTGRSDPIAFAPNGTLYLTYGFYVLNDASFGSLPMTDALGDSGGFYRSGNFASQTSAAGFSGLLPQKEIKIKIEAVV